MRTAEFKPSWKAWRKDWFRSEQDGTVSVPELSTAEHGYRTCEQFLTAKSHLCRLWQSARFARSQCGIAQRTIRSRREKPGRLTQADMGQAFGVCPKLAISRSGTACRSPTLKRKQATAMNHIELSECGNLQLDSAKVAVNVYEVPRSRP